MTAPACTTWSTKSSTTRSTKRWPDSASHVEVTIHYDNSVTVEDNGRGMPVDMHKTENRPAPEVIMTVLHAGGKFDHGSYKVSGGLHGVGVSVVNALSEWVKLEIRKNGKVYYQEYRRGDPATAFKQTGVVDRARAHVGHQGDVQARPADLQHHRVQLRHAGAAAARAVVPQQRPADHDRRRAQVAQAHDFKFAGGMASFVEDLNNAEDRGARQADPLHGDAKDGIEVEIAMQWNDSYPENIFCFTNNIKNKDGGTHLTGFRQALTRTVNAYATAANLLKDLKQGLSGARPVARG